MKTKLFLLVFLLCPLSAIGGEPMEWPFDQARNVSTITTDQVLNQAFPILLVVHYKDDHSWAFLCGTTNETEDLKLVTMEQIVAFDRTLFGIADLPPGWSATRKSIDAPWVRVKDE